MRLVLQLLDNSVAQKIVAALTGLGLIGFVIVHMLGNLQVFVGPEAINSYAVKLKDLGALLWIARIGLLALVVTHIAMTIRLAVRNRKLRGGRYALATHQASTKSSRSMALSGSLILAFIIFHLLHFTFGYIQPELYALSDAEGRHDVYSMVTLGFQNLGIAAIYLAAMFFLFSHLAHAMFSAWRTLGLKIGGNETVVRPIARVVAVLTVVGFASVPLASLLGWFEG